MVIFGGQSEGCELSRCPMHAHGPFVTHEQAQLVAAALPEWMLPHILPLQGGDACLGDDQLPAAAELFDPGLDGPMRVAGQPVRAVVVADARELTSLRCMGRDCHALLLTTPLDGVAGWVQVLDLGWSQIERPGAFGREQVWLCGRCRREGR